MATPIPYGRQTLSEGDIQAVVDVLRSDYLTQGPAVERFEHALRDYTGAKYCVAVANGTAALHIAVASLDLPVGSEGITSPITFTASATSMVYGGLVPRFADIDAETVCISPTEIEKCLTAKTRLLIPVHFSGRVCDMPAISDLARRNSLRVIEDAAHAIGSEYPQGGRVGSCRYSDLTIFSFHPVKTITTGEGGAVTTNDPDLYEKLKLLRSHGITKDVDKLTKNPGPWFYEMQTLGFNYRLTDIQAALGVSQLTRLEQFKQRRMEIVGAYNQAFSRLAWLRTPCQQDHASYCYHLYVVQIDFGALGMPRKTVMEQLRQKGILTQVHYIPVHTQPFYQNNFRTKRGICAHAEAYYEKALSLPLYQGMTDTDVARVIDAVKELQP